ncbi:hypothetical protein QJS04_geneDACA000060 [Acorus gramineus]|uniref:Uncharacterized protein n=1 Tax=Acorus gramineus TaxID=55184 RepID=A0AAV9AS74_ACOGR|nr:hypothetical protein QJS04_geneDACA000060 [Acorus gramineus]
MPVHFLLHENSPTKNLCSFPIQPILSSLFTTTQQTQQQDNNNNKKTKLSHHFISSPMGCVLGMISRATTTTTNNREGEMEERLAALEEEVKSKGRAQEKREAEWRKERRRMKEEILRLRRNKKVEEDAAAVVEVGSVGNGYLLERMREERALREEAVEKWKQLYLAIKIELDDLICKTHQGLYQGVNQGAIEGLRGELKVKEDMVEELRSKVVAMEKEKAKKEREVDILRQSLRILSNAKKTRSAKVVS